MIKKVFFSYIRKGICLIMSSLKVDKQKLITFVQKPIAAPSVVETGQQAQ